jgi:hypothetical protein
MTKRDLIELLKDVPDDAMVKIVDGTDSVRVWDSMICCNHERQAEINEVWLSKLPGFPPRVS